MRKPDLILSVFKPIIELQRVKVITTFSVSILVLKVPVTSCPSELWLCLVGCMVEGTEAWDIILKVLYVLTASLPAIRIRKWVHYSLVWVFGLVLFQRENHGFHALLVK